VPLVIKEDTVEARILHILLEAYPVTVKDIEWELKVGPARVQRTLKALASRGIIELEKLPDKTYVRLLRSDISFIGRKPSQRRRVKHRGKKRKTDDYDGPMFG
jgi:DNA-binding MarR family transcriptional regulator